MVLEMRKMLVCSLMFVIILPLFSFTIISACNNNSVLSGKDNDIVPFNPVNKWGPYVGGARNETIPAPDGHTFIDIITYPAKGSGTHGWNYATDKSGGPYPVLTFAPGYGATAYDWAGWGMYFGSWGFVCVFLDIGTGYGSFPPNVAVGSQIYALDYLSGLTSSHWLYGMANSSNAGAFGHSVGGRVCIGAPSNDTRFHAVAPLNAAEWSSTDPRFVHVPIQYIVGTNDVDWRDNTVNYLYPRSNPVKSMIQIKGMGHSGDLTQAWLSMSYMVTFFLYWLNHSTQYYSWVYGVDVKGDSAVIFECDVGGKVSEFISIYMVVPTVGLILLSLLIIKQRNNGWEKLKRDLIRNT